jgi:hypothetical protein
MTKPDVNAISESVKAFHATENGKKFFDYLDSQCGSGGVYYGQGGIVDVNATIVAAAKHEIGIIINKFIKD